VVKNSPSEQRFIDQAVTEYEISKQLDSPLIRKVHKLIRQRALLRTSEVLVLMELVVGQTLESIKFNGMVSYCKLFHAAAKGLKCMHDAGFVHADIKPNNIMVTKQGTVKLIDFGQSCKNGTVKERIQGTPDYIAPEQVKRQPITPKTDMFNLGATMYWLLTEKRVPTMMPRKKDRGETVQLRTEEPEKTLQPPIELRPDCPPALSNLILECVAKDPNDRPDHMQSVMDRVEIAAGQAKRAQSESKTGQVNDQTLAENSARTA
jgi:serine/threonine-protein kinase